LSLLFLKQTRKIPCLFAGKGHEIYQEIKGKRYPFNEENIVNACLEKYRPGEEKCVE
jgi:UDP-N-acetylmuramyl tripeptide synthase